MDYTLLFKGARVVDGSGGPGYRADVALEGERIAAVGNLSGASAARVVDAGGLWERDEFPTVDAAEAACRALGIRAHRGWDDPRLNRRLNARDQWNTPDGQRRAL